MSISCNNGSITDDLFNNAICDDDLPATQPVDDRILKDVVAYAEVRSASDNRTQSVKRELELLGATVVNKFTNDVTHVVFKEGSKRTLSKAEKKGIHLVSVLWVENCKLNQEHVSERMYPAVVPRCKGPGTPLLFTKLKKSKSMQPVDFEEELASSTDRLKRKRKRIDTKSSSKYSSFDNTPVNSPRPIVLVQDTQQVSQELLQEEGYILTPIRLTIPDTPPSMRERMKQMKLAKAARLGSDAGYDVENGSESDTFDKFAGMKQLQKHLFSDGEGEDTADTSVDNDLHNLADNINSTLNASHSSSQSSFAINSQKSPKLQNSQNVLNTQEIISAASSSKTTKVKFAEFLLKSPVSNTTGSDDDGNDEVFTSTQNGVAFPGIMQNYKQSGNGSGDSPCLRRSMFSDNNNGGISHNYRHNLNYKSNNLKNKSPTTGRDSDGTTSQMSKNLLENLSNSKTTNDCEEVSPVIEVQKAETVASVDNPKHRRRSSRRLSVKQVVAQLDDSFALTAPLSQEDTASVDDKSSMPQVHQSLGSQVVTTSVVDKALAELDEDPLPMNSRIRAQRKSDIIVGDVNMESDGIEIKHDTKTGKRNSRTRKSITNSSSKDSDNGQGAAESEAKLETKTAGSKKPANRGMKKKLMSLTDLNDHRHSVLMEPTKCSQVERPQLEPCQPIKRGRRRKTIAGEEISSASCSKDKSEVGEVNEDKNKGNKDKRKDISNDTKQNDEHRKTSKRSSKGKVQDDADNTATGAVVKPKSATSRRKCYNDNNAPTTDKLPSSRGKRKSVGGNISVATEHTKTKKVRQSKNETAVADNTRTEIEDDAANVTESRPKPSQVTSTQIQDITTQLNLTKDNSLMCSLRETTLSLSMSTAYTDANMPSFLQPGRKSVDEFSLSQKNGGKKGPGKRISKSMKTSSLTCVDENLPSSSSRAVERNLPMSTSSDSDGVVAGKKSRLNGSGSRKTFRPSIVMTSLHSHEQDVVISVVKNLGGFVISENVNETTSHVICGEPRRTLNVLQCLARGVWLLDKEWVLKSLDAGGWIPETDYEMERFFPACKVTRLEREKSPEFYRQTIFSDVGPVYISGRAKPPRNCLVQLIKLCGGKVTGIREKASVYVGSDYHPGMTCVNTNWLLDSVTTHELVPMERYLLDRPKRECSPVY